MGNTYGCNPHEEPSGREYKGGGSLYNYGLQGSVKTSTWKVQDCGRDNCKNRDWAYATASKNNTGVERKDQR